MSVRVATGRNPKDQANARLLHVLSVGLQNRSSPSIGVANVQVRDAPGRGKGLFAIKDLQVGTEAARMTDSARMRRGAWEIYHKALGLPHDAAIFVARSPLVFYDQGWQTSYEQGSFQSMNFIPDWYRLNHASTRDAPASSRKSRAGARGEASSAASTEDGMGFMCSICLETVNGKTVDSGGVLLRCNHSFHHGCITQWIVKGTREQLSARSRCPNCRTPIVSMCALDENGVQGCDIPIPEMAAAVADAERDGFPLVHFGPRVHSGVARALRTLQSELLGVAPVGRHRNR